jgi:hypothetical protein
MKRPSQGQSDSSRRGRVSRKHRFWRSADEERAARKAIEAHSNSIRGLIRKLMADANRRFVLLPEESKDEWASEFCRFIDVMKSPASRARANLTTTFDVIVAFAPHLAALYFPLPKEERRKWGRMIRNLLVSIGREYVENGATAETLPADFLSHAPGIVAAFRPYRDQIDVAAILRTVDDLLPAIAVWSLRTLERDTRGLEARIRALEEEARQAETIDPEDAELLRKRADHLRLLLPREFVAAPKRAGRPRLNPWRMRLLHLLFEDGMPNNAIARLLGHAHAAAVRKVRKAEKSTRSALAEIASVRIDQK